MMDREERDELRGLLAAIDVPDCGCPLDLSCPCGESCPPGADCPCCRGECDHPPSLFQPPCRHVLACTCSLTLEEWAKLVAAADRAEPPEPAPALVLSREARVAVLARRHGRGEGLWSRHDLMPEDVDHLGQTIRLTAGNNRPKGDKLVIEGEK